MSRLLINCSSVANKLLLFVNASDDLPLYIVFLLLFINQLINFLTACWTLSIL